METVTVTVQQADRLMAINNLSMAIKDVARALATNVEVSISGCTFKGGNPAVNIDTAQDVTETEIVKVAPSVEGK